MRVVQVKENQSLLDIAIEEYGKIEAVFDIIRLNNFQGLVDNLDVGMRVHVNDEGIHKTKKDYLQRYAIHSLDEHSKGRGIGFWAIGKDFTIH